MWRIYYDDGSYIDQNWGVPIGDRARGVQAVLQEDENGDWIVTSKSDYYVKRGDRWFGVDQNGLWDYLLDTGLVMFGRTIASNEFNVILNGALSERAERKLNGPT